MKFQWSWQACMTLILSITEPDNIQMIFFAQTKLLKLKNVGFLPPLCRDQLCSKILEFSCFMSSASLCKFVR